MTERERTSEQPDPKAPEAPRASRPYSGPGPTELEPLVVTSTTAKKVINVGNTKFWALVKLGKIRMIDIGVGHRMVDYRSLKALLDQ